MKIFLLALVFATGSASAGPPTSPATIAAKTVTQKATFKIKGMVCQSCANHLTTVLGKTKGVTHVDSVDYKKGSASVTYDPKVTDESKIKAAINTTQYKVVEQPAKTE